MPEKSPQETALGLLEYKRRPLKRIERGMLKPSERHLTEDQGWKEAEAAIEEQRKASEALQREELDRAFAEARSQLGYAQSAGYGTGGAWEARRTALERGGLQERMKLGYKWDEFEAAQNLKWLYMQDQQAFQLELAKYTADIQKDLMKYMAELNDPSWWEQIGWIVGTGLSIWNPWAGAATAAKQWV